MHTHMNEATYRRLALASCMGVLSLVCATLPASAQQPGLEQPPDPAAARAEAAALLSESLETAREQAGPMLIVNAREAAQEALQGATSRAAELDLGGIPIGNITFDCDDAICDTPLERSLLLQLPGLKPGHPFQRASQVRARERLLKTGMFEEPRFGFRVREEGGKRLLDLTIGLERTALIRKIDFVGIRPPPFVEDFERILSYREGQVWTGDKKEEQEQLEAMDELLEKEGFFDSAISIAVEREGKMVDLTFRVRKGQSLKICELGIRGVREFPYADARSKLFSARPIWTRYLTFITPIYTERMLRAGGEALIAAYRERGYYQARLVDETVRDIGEPDCVRVLVDVTEGPKWETRFEGNKAITSRELARQLTFQETGYVDQAAIEEAARRLEKIYATRGYPFAKVSGEERYGADRFDRQIYFKVEEGARFEIERIKLEAAGGGPRKAKGIAKLSDEELLGKMRTQPFGLFESGGYLQLEELEGDIARIEESYRAQGFLRATVSEFLVLSDTENNKLEIRVRIQEGPRTTVSKVVFPDQPPIPEPKKRSGAKIKPLPTIVNLEEGAPLSLLDARADGARITQNLASLGYPMASVKTTCVSSCQDPRPCEQPRRPNECELERVEPTVGSGDPDTTRRYQRALTTDRCAWTAPPHGEEVVVRHEAERGPPVRVGAILISGNFVTDPRIILGEIPLETGGSFDVKKLLEGQANLRSLGLFDSVSIEAVGLDDGALLEEQASAALVVSVDEGDYYYFDLSFGVQGRDLLDNTRRKLLAVADIEYNNRNFRGRAQRLQPRGLLALDMLQFSQLGYGLVLQQLDRRELATRFDVLTGLELVYSHPRFLKQTAGVQNLLLTIAPYALLDLIGVTNNNLQREEFGARSELRKELAELLERFFVTFGLEGKSVATRDPEAGLFTPDGRRLFSPRRVVGKIYVDTSLDRRDSPLNPTKGFYLQLSPQLVNSDALNQQNISGALTNAFFRLSFSGSGYIPIGKSLVFGQSFRFGQIFPLSERRLPVPADERYVLGGVSSLRGFPESGINARVPSYRDLQRGGEFVMNTNTELRYPLLRRYGFYGATFMDVGVLADCFNDENITEAASCYTDAFPREEPLRKVRASAGFGVRYLVADQIPLLLDYAMLLNRKPGESFGYLHFNVGYTF